MDTRPAPLTARERLVAAAIVVVGSFASLWRLTDAQVLPDEVVYLQAGASLVAGEGDPNPEHPPLAKFLFGLAGELVDDPLLGGRLVAAVAAVSIAVLLFWLVRRIAGNRAGLLAAGLWAALPVGGGSSGPLSQAGRLDRFAMLDPVATALALGAVAAGWSWLQRPRWQAAAATGLLGGLAAAAKPTGVLVLPAIALVVLWTRRREFPLPASGVAVAVLGSLVGLAAGFAVLGDGALEQLRFLAQFQGGRLDEGHVVAVAGTTTAFPPWWSHLWFHVRDDGPVLTAVLLAGAFAAPWLVRDDEVRRRGVALLIATFGVVFIALAATTVKLDFYRYAWWPLLVALLAIALDGAERRREARERTDPVWFGALGAAVVLAWTSLSHLAGVATLGPGGYQQVADVLVASDPGGPLLLRGRAAVLGFYLPDGDLDRTDDLGAAAAVLLDPGITSRFPRPDVESVVGDPAWSCQAFEELTLCLRSPS